jgi:iron complex transport system permease protein
LNANFPNSARFAILLLLAVASLALAVVSGSVSLDWQGIVDGGIARSIVFDLRLPRAAGAFACGGLLALAGALMQVLLRNPLADPYVLGVSGGAAVGALLAMLAGGAALLVGGASFGGALAAVLLVFALAHGEGSWTQTRLLLTGVIVAAGCGAIVALILTLAPEQALRGMLFWLMGDAAQITDPWPALVLLAGGLLLSLPFARDLNALARGEVLAQALGVHVGRLRRLIYFLAALLTAAAVTTAGSIGFVGLVVPHLARMLVGNDQRLLLPAAVLAGGTLLTFADTMARTVLAPQQLPVGVLTAIVGVPLFLLLLSRQPKSA